MNLEPTEEQRALRATVRRFLADHAPVADDVRPLLRRPDPKPPRPAGGDGEVTAARSGRPAPPAPPNHHGSARSAGSGLGASVSSSVWGGLVELGATGVLVPQDHGGAGLTMAEAGIVAEELGRALHPGPWLSTAVAATRALVRLATQEGAGTEDEAEVARLLAGIADGSTIATLALPDPVVSVPAAAPSIVAWAEPAATTSRSAPSTNANRRRDAPAPTAADGDPLGTAAPTAPQPGDEVPPTGDEVDMPGIMTTTERRDGDMLLSGEKTGAPDPATTAERHDDQGTPSGDKVQVGDTTTATVRRDSAVTLTDEKPDRPNSPTTAVRRDGVVMLSGEKVDVPDAAAATVMLVLAGDGEETALFAVDMSAPGVEVMPQAGVDLTRPLFRVRFDGVPARRLGTMPVGSVQDLVDDVLVAWAADALGAAQAVFELAVDYAKVRTQFGRPIGAFQAVQHLCVDMYETVELARGGVMHALWAADAAGLSAEERHLAAVRAKAFSGRLATVGDIAVQVFGGIGFTWEHDAHLYLRRLLGWSAFLGPPGPYLQELGAELARSAPSRPSAPTTPTSPTSPTVRRTR